MLALLFGGQYKYMKNYGLQIQSKRPTDYFLGALNETEINPSGDWIGY